MIAGKYNKWIVIFQEFDLEFVSENLKNSLIFVELIYVIPILEEYRIHEDSFVDASDFLISNVDPCYGDIIIYLYTFKVPSHLLRD